MGDRTRDLVRSSNDLLAAIDSAIGDSAQLRLEISRDRCSRAVDRVLDSACSALGSAQVRAWWTDELLSDDVRGSLLGVDVSRQEDGCCDDDCDCMGTDEIERLDLSWVVVDPYFGHERVHWFRAGPAEVCDV